MLTINFEILATILWVAGMAHSNDTTSLLDIVFDIKRLVAKLDYYRADAEAAKESRESHDSWADIVSDKNQAQRCLQSLSFQVENLDHLAYKWCVKSLSVEDEEDWCRELLAQLFPTGDSCSHKELATRIWDLATRP